MLLPSRLYDGYNQYRSGCSADELRQFRSLSEGQTPSAMIIGCSDSRVDPVSIFSAAPGELFVARNVAGFVPPNSGDSIHPEISAALEYAVCALAVPNIVVLGHAKCGGVHAAFDSASERPVSYFVKQWVKPLAAVYRELGECEHSVAGLFSQKNLEQLAVRQSLKNLMSFPFVADAVRNGTLTIDGAWFLISEGSLFWLDQSTDEFELV